MNSFSRLLPILLWAAAADAQTLAFSIDRWVEIPGGVLHPGNYVLQIRRDAPGRYLINGLALLELRHDDENRPFAAVHVLEAQGGFPPGAAMLSYYEGASGRRALKSWNLLSAGRTERVVYPVEQSRAIARFAGESVLSLPPSVLSGAGVEKRPAGRRPFPQIGATLPVVLLLALTVAVALILFKKYRRKPESLPARGVDLARRAASSAYEDYKASRESGFFSER